MYVYNLGNVVEKLLVCSARKTHLRTKQTKKGFTPPTSSMNVNAWLISVGCLKRYLVGQQRSFAASYRIMYQYNSFKGELL